MEYPCIEQKNGGYYIRGSRVSLDSIVYAYNEGSTIEKIKLSFPVLTIDEISEAIVFYIRNRDHVDEHLAESEVLFEKERLERKAILEREAPDLARRLRTAQKLLPELRIYGRFNKTKFEELLKQSK